MKAHFQLLFALFFISVSFGQTIYTGKVVNKQNDTLNVEFKFKGTTEVAKLMALQEKVTVVSNGNQTDYYPADIASFTLKLGGKIYIFDSVDGVFFAQRMYSGNLKLYKFFKQTFIYPNYTTFRVYLVRKPDGRSSEMVAMGLSRLITKKTMLPQIEDCKISYDKIKNDEIKIKNEAILVEFIKDYENNCFKN